MKVIEVVGAVIVSNGEVLCAQRGSEDKNLPLKWEFPGGKIESGESPRQALEREIQEELHCRIEVGREITTTVHPYDFATISLTTFFCRLIDGTPSLSEHADIQWLAPEVLSQLDWAPADIPAVHIVSESTLL